MRNAILILTFLSVSFTTLSAQSMSCQQLFNIVTKDYDSKDYTTCYNSTMLTKVEYYRVDGAGFVVAYIKNGQYDYIGKPYIFCGISQQRWSTFKTKGMLGSWGEAFHEYIRDYTCNCY